MYDYFLSSCGSDVPDLSLSFMNGAVHLWSELKSWMCTCECMRVYVCVCHWELTHAYRPVYSNVLGDILGQGLSPDPVLFFSLSFCSKYLNAALSRSTRFCVFSPHFHPHSSHLPVGLTCWQGNILRSQQKTTVPWAPAPQSSGHAICGATVHRPDCLSKCAHVWRISNALLPETYIAQIPWKK